MPPANGDASNLLDLALAAARDAGADAAPATEEAPSLEALATRGPSEMPRMREVVRSADATSPTTVASGSSDACFRAAIGASAPVRAWFEDEARVARGGELSAAAGLVPPRGPVCVRRGETLRLVVDARPETIARAIVWQSP
ncbi:MAG: hypothetical protein KF764_18780 [Labilithrix sp.]|nr:hypothetical protein [Labilithrix sp.]